MRPFLAWILLISPLLLLGACAEELAPGVMETRHCTTVLNFLNRNLGETTADEPRVWEGEGSLNITIPYRVAVTSQRQAQPTMQRDTILCRYALEPQRENMVVDLVAVRQRGVNLTTEQMRVVNIAMRVFR
ncbi:hypothetical protein [Magnetospira sp. QH-2]|uniref:hypothetical protein n=1 Tax=Magnetospira sp. (strain QH-2) TaxID=1288970 RepID=UPI0003E80D7B|nr:hypothetical protein [Magnetospira sp. QH-2]CCQ73965.1 Exported protein of unknown function [Magnetospira sp. QH-2]